MENNLHLEFVIDDPTKRGYFIPVDKLGDFIRANMGRVMYHSYYAFDQDLIAFKNNHGSLTGFSGKQYPYRTIIDIDAEDNDIPSAAQSTYAIAEHLSEVAHIDENNIQVWFSGSKGFHIHMNNPFGFTAHEELHAHVKATLKEYFSKWEYHVDLMPTMKTGLIRCAWSKNIKTGLFKVPVSIEELYNIATEQLRVDAIANQDAIASRYDIIETPMNQSNDGLLSEHIIKATAPKNWQQMQETDHISSVVTCMQKLALRGPVTGRRHQDALRLVSSWRRNGIMSSMARVMLLEWLGIDRNQATPEWNKLIESVYKNGYSYSCQDEVMKEFCDKQCIFFKNKDFVLEIADSEDMNRNLKSYLQNVSGNGVDIAQGFGFKNLSYKFVPGDVVVVTGDTGTGKTAFVQNIINFVREETLYFNLEMHESLLYRRALQIRHEMTKSQVNQWIYDGHDFSEDLKFLKVLSISPDIAAVERIILQNPYKYVVIDTSDGISHDKAGNNEYKKLGDIVNMLRVVAQTNGKIVILIHHLKKRKDVTKLIQLDDLAGNRAIVTKMDHVFALEYVDDERRMLRMLKARDQDKMVLNFKINFSTFTFEPDYVRNRSYDGGNSTLTTGTSSQ